MPLAKWLRMLTPATARKKTLDADPASPTYGNETTGPDFSVGYQKMSSTELERMGRAYGTDMYVVLADLPADNTPPAGKHDTLNVDGLGDLDIVALIDYRQPKHRMVRMEAEKRA